MHCLQWHHLKMLALQLYVFASMDPTVAALDVNHDFLMLPLSHYLFLTTFHPGAHCIHWVLQAMRTNVILYAS